MITVDSVNSWIQANVLDSKAWDESSKQQVAVTQAIRNLERWYPEVELNDELVAYQAIWELQGLDPVVKYQKQGIKHISEDGDRIEYDKRDKVSPEVREILGTPSFELEEETILLEGGMLL